jgi:glycerol dehydrogenase-like iron-containing ADH family enzyme
MNYYKITKKIDVKEYLQKLNDNCLIIYSKTSILKNDINIQKNNFKTYSTNELTIKKENIDKLIDNLDGYSKIICIGGGTATDIGKYLSSKFKKNLICIPTMLSTNAYSTDKVALLINGKKETLNANISTQILFDKNILKKSKENNLYGIADIFSISTALNDWLLAAEFNSENITSEFEWAQQLLHLTIKYILDSELTKIEEDIFIIYKLVGEAGEITNQYGSGKPESGSEHIFAKALEKEIKIPHAIAVANGILLMSISQALYMGGKFDINPYLALKKLGIYDLNNQYNISYELISKVFLNLKPRKDRYTVVNLIYNDKEKKKKVLVEYKKIIENE